VVAPNPTPKTIVSIIGRLSRKYKFQGHEENNEKRKRQKERDKGRERYSEKG
jgi:hypothetical protein